MRTKLLRVSEFISFWVGAKVSFCDAASLRANHPFNRLAQFLFYGFRPNGRMGELTHPPVRAKPLSTPD